MPLEFSFVSTDGAGKVTPSERQAIRSHCMRGKNKKPDSRRSRREAARKEAAEKAKIKPAARPRDEDSSDSAPTPAPIASDPEFPEPLIRIFSYGVGRPSTSIGSDWAVFPFPSPLDAPSQKLMHQYYLRNPIRDMLYPFKHYGIRIDFKVKPMWCFMHLCSDTLYFHMVKLLASAADDLVSRQPLSSSSRQYLRQVIPVLNQRLSQRNAHRSDVTLYVVAVLAAVAVLFGEHHTARTHALGLSQMIRLRGTDPVPDESSNPAFQMAIDRLNFSSSLISPIWPWLYDDPAWQMPTIPPHVIQSFKDDDMLSLNAFVNPALAPFLEILQHTTIILNKNYRDNLPIDGFFIRPCLGTVHSGLRDMPNGEDRMKHPLSECIRLAAMAILAATYRLRDMPHHPYSRSLRYRLSEAYVAVKRSTSDLPLSLETWLVLVLAMSYYGPDTGAYLSHTFQDAAVAKCFTWEEARGHAKKVLWIDAFHDDLGKKAWEQLRRSGKVQVGYLNIHMGNV